MPYSNKQMLRDANGDLIPQYWDVAEQEFKPLTGRDGANDVRLTGSKVEKEVIYERKVRTKSTDRVVVIPPAGTKIALLEHHVHGVTGTFASEEGHKLESAIVYSESRTGERPFLTVETSLSRGTSSQGHFGILFHPGANLLDAEIVRNGAFKMVGITPYPALRARLVISGSFADGEGIDSELIAHYLI